MWCTQFLLIINIVEFADRSSSSLGLASYWAARRFDFSKCYPECGKSVFEQVVLLIADWFHSDQKSKVRWFHTEFFGSKSLCPMLSGRSHVFCWGNIFTLCVSSREPDHLQFNRKYLGDGCVVVKSFTNNKNSGPNTDLWMNPLVITLLPDLDCPIRTIRKFAHTLQ